MQQNIATKYLESGNQEEQRQNAVSELYNFYINSDKTQKYYEVISKKNGRFILNYCPSGEVLTICSDPGSGWSTQYREVDDQDLRRIIQKGWSLEKLELPGYLEFDEGLTYNRNFIAVETNGHPSL